MEQQVRSEINSSLFASNFTTVLSWPHRSIIGITKQLIRMEHGLFNPSATHVCVTSHKNLIYSYLLLWNQVLFTVGCSKYQL